MAMPPGLMEMLAGLGGPGGTPGAGAAPGGEPGGMHAMGLAALDQLNPKSANGSQSLAKVQEALKLAHQLIMTSLVQVGQWNPTLSRDLHGIGRQLLDTSSELTKEQPLGPPPDMGMGAMGTQGAMGASAAGGPLG